jgi:hypothetical protein
MKQRILLAIGLILGCWIALSVGLTVADPLAQPATVENGWTTVFTETFTNTLTLWTFTETTSTGYQWGVIPYSKTIGVETRVNDFGLWAPGGGTEGEKLVWPTDTYTNNMNTMAIAGPITLTNDIADVHVQFRVFNNIDQNDVFFVALSLDGTSFTDVMTVTAPPLSWQEVNWTTSDLSGADELWVIFSFMSDNSGVHTGPLVDDIVLEVRSESKVYLPLMKLDPTPTATPILDYIDQYDDPGSGWFVGPAMRLNRRYLNGEWIFRWEAVNWINYVDGHYQMYIPLTCHGNDESNPDTWFVRTVEYAPMPSELSPLPQNYCVETSAYMAGSYDPNYLLAHWGVVFGGNAAKTQVYTFQINSLGRYHILKYDNYVYPGRREDPNFPGENIRIALIDVGSENDWGIPNVPVNSSHNYNNLKAVVRGNQVDVYINGQYVNTADISGMPRDRVGVFGASWEPTPVDIRFDTFHYDPFCPEVQ